MIAREPVSREAEAASRSFMADGREWTARLVGEGVAGTGRLGLAPLVAIRFYAAGDDRPRFEALLPTGRFDSLFEAELARLLARARPLKD